MDSCGGIIQAFVQRGVGIVCFGMPLHLPSCQLIQEGSELQEPLRTKAFLVILFLWRPLCPPAQVMALLTTPLTAILGQSTRQVGGFITIAVLGVVGIYLK